MLFGTFNQVQLITSSISSRSHFTSIKIYLTGNSHDWQKYFESLLTMSYFLLLTNIQKKQTLLNFDTSRIQFKVLTTLPMTISSFLLEFRGF